MKDDAGITPLNIAIIGAGNMGSLYGANLSRIGQCVTLIDPWEEHVNRIQENGLHMTGLKGDFTARVSATSDPRAVEEIDIAVILVNTYSTRSAANAAKRMLKESGYALTLQNGLGNLEILEEILGTGRVMAGLSYHSGDLQEPGWVEHTNEGPTYLGEIDCSQSQRLRDLERLMQKAGMNPVVEPDIMSTIWGKFVHNCGINAICGITELRPGHIQDIPELDVFQTRVIEEAMALVKAKGIAIPEMNPLEAIKEYSSGKFHRVSMYQHLLHQRQTEIDALNGFVVRESKKLGLACPYNESLTALIKGRQYNSR